MALLALSVGIAAIFTVARLIARQPVDRGLVAAGVAAGIAAFAGEASNNFIPGFITPCTARPSWRLRSSAGR